MRVHSNADEPRDRKPRRGRRALLFILLAAFLLTAPRDLKAQDPVEADGALSAEVDATGDEQIAEGLRRRYDQIAGLENLRVSVSAGVVTLTGEVLAESVREEAVGLAGRVEGVARVQDKIKVVVDPRERLLPALEEALARLRVLVSYLPLVAVSLALVFVFFLLSRLVGSFHGLFERISPNRFAQDLLRQAIKMAILLTGVLIALEILDATALVGAVLGTAGVIGLALGFAFKDLAENYISSILLSIRQPFAPNDSVEIDGQAGKVVRLTSRATILMTFDGNHLRIPNSRVFKGIILNYSRNPRRRFDFGVGVGAGEDLTAAQRLGTEALEAIPGVLDDPSPMAMIEALGDSNVLLRFYGWVDQRETSFGKAKSEAIRRVKAVLEEAGMDLPEPIYRVNLLKPSEASSPGETRASPQPTASSLPADVRLEDQLERQIAEDREDAGQGSDLLDVGGPAE